MKFISTVLLMGLLLCVACHSHQARQAEAKNDSIHIIPSSLLKAGEPDIKLSQEALLGKINPAQDTGFVLIGREFTNKEKIYLRKPTYEAFLRMAKAAREAGHNLQIISATRNFSAQKRIWEAKWNGQRKVAGMDLSQAMPDLKQRALKILEYSSMPGTSRHHWGTDLDINALNNRYFTSGKGKRIYDWLLDHASAYGFCQVYTQKGTERPHGYNEEKWHWSYMPLSSQFLEQYNQQIDYDDLGGFEGEQVARELEAIRKYVNGIAPPCLLWE